jgi:hypothetical protein
LPNIGYFLFDIFILPSALIILQCRNRKDLLQLSRAGAVSQMAPARTIALKFKFILKSHLI